MRYRWAWIDKETGKAVNISGKRFEAVHDSLDEFILQRGEVQILFTEYKECFLYYVVEEEV